MSELHESTGSYALNALDPGELTEFEAHLATYPTCQDEVAELCETAAELSLLSLATPAPALRGNILAAIAMTPLADGEAASTSAAVSTNGSRSTVEALRAVRPSDPHRAMSGSITDEPESAPVDEFALRRQRRSVRWSRPAARRRHPPRTGWPPPTCDA